MRRGWFSPFVLFSVSLKKKKGERWFGAFLSVQLLRQTDFQPGGAVFHLTSHSSSGGNSHATIQMSDGLEGGWKMTATSECLNSLCYQDLQSVQFPSSITASHWWPGHTEQCSSNFSAHYMIKYQFCFCLLISLLSHTIAAGIDAGACTHILGVKRDVTLPGQSSLWKGCFAMKPLAWQATNLLIYKLYYLSSFLQSSFYHLLPLIEWNSIVIEFLFFSRHRKTKANSMRRRWFRDGLKLLCFRCIVMLYLYLGCPFPLVQQSQ